MKASISQVKAFKSCRRSYYFKYDQKLKPVQTAESLATGTAYHALIESLEKGEELPEDEFTKENAMAHAYQKYILPQFKVTETEVKLEKQIGDHILFGHLDGLSDDGYIVEHKTTSMDISEGGEYEYNLLWDEQVLAYMSLSGRRKVHYTVCKKPTIRLRQNETEEEFYKRMIAWYDEDTDSKIRTFVVERTDAEVAEFEDEFMAICDTIVHTGHFYKNTCQCNAWGRRCEYSSICLHYDPAQEYLEFTKWEGDR